MQIKKYIWNLVVYLVSLKDIYLQIQGILLSHTQLKCALNLHLFALKGADRALNNAPF